MKIYLSLGILLVLFSPGICFPDITTYSDPVAGITRVISTSDTFDYFDPDTGKTIVFKEFIFFKDLKSRNYSLAFVINDPQELSIVTASAKTSGGLYYLPFLGNSVVKMRENDVESKAVFDANDLANSILNSDKLMLTLTTQNQKSIVFSIPGDMLLEWKSLVRDSP